MEPEQIVVVHDELDLPVAALKVKSGGGLAGHNGLRSIKAHLHSDDVPAGADRRRQAGRRRSRAPTTCCNKFSKRERAEIDVTIEQAADAVETHRHRRRRRRHEPLQPDRVTVAWSRVRRRRAPDVSGTLDRTTRGATHARCRRALTIDTDLPIPPPLAAAAPRWLLAEEPALRAVIGRQPRSSRCPTPARALFVAALAGVTHPPAARCSRCRPAPRPSASPTTSRSSSPPATVELFPAWETLPFERVSPSLETMGRRLRVLWRLRIGHAARRRWWRRCARWCSGSARTSRTSSRSSCAPGDRVDRDELVARLVAVGYRREYQVEARGEVAVRGSIVDVYPSTDDHPVRIDLWGDEVDRLSAFSVADQRSTHDVDEVVRSSRPASCSRPTRCAQRAAALVRAEPWGREQWERLAEGQVFDGMESWLPWLTADEHLLPDLLPDDALVLLVEPKRMRDRAQELLDEEAALAATLAVTWGATGRGRWQRLPRLSLSFDRLLAHTDGRRGVTSLTTPEGPDTPRLAATAFDPVVGDTAALARRLRALAARRRTASCSRPRAPGRRTASRDVLAGDGVDAVRGDDRARRGRRRRRAARARRRAPGRGLALVAEADLTGRRRVHRRARGARRGADYYDALTPATTSCTTSTASVATSG